MKLAKPRFDIGVFTNDLEPMMEFWRDAIGLEYAEALTLAATSFSIDSE